jgi:hypothetical protein
LGAKKKAAKAYLRQVKAEEKAAEAYIRGLPYAIGISIIMTAIMILSNPPWH